MRDFTSPPSVTPVPITDIAPPDLEHRRQRGHPGDAGDRPRTRTMYLVARTKENGTYVQRLHALDISDRASIARGARSPSRDPLPAMRPTRRSAPAVGSSRSTRRCRRSVPRSRSTNGVVLVAWAAHEDLPPYHGWIMGFDATTLARVGTSASRPTITGGGIWQGGRAPTIDAAGNAYFATGNGKWDGTRNFGDSLLKFSVARDRADAARLLHARQRSGAEAGDDDLSGSGFTLLPGTNLLLGGGKEGVALSDRRGQPGHNVVERRPDLQRIPVSGRARDGRPGILELGRRRPARLQLVRRRRAAGVSVRQRQAA